MTRDSLDRRRPPRRPALVLMVGLAVVAGLALGIGIDIVRTGGLQAWLERDRPAATYAALGRVVAVDGRAVYLDCRGTGSPTLILETGFGGGADGWGTLLDGLAAITRTCAWDRPGIGRSAPRGLHSAGQTAEDLHAALEAAGELGPYVVVAHSLGGVYARLFAATSGSGGATGGPSRTVVALVMLDTYEPDLGMDTDPSLDADFRRQIRESLDDGAEIFRQGEGLDWPTTLTELATLSAPGTRPPTLLLYTDPYARYPDQDAVRQELKVAAWWRAIRALYPEGEVEIVANSSHFIQFDQPALVIERVRAMIERLRS